MSDPTPSAVQKDSIAASDEIRLSDTSTADIVDQIARAIESRIGTYDNASEVYDWNTGKPVDGPMVVALARAVLAVPLVAQALTLHRDIKEICASTTSSTAQAIRLIGERLRAVADGTNTEREVSDVAADGIRLSDTSLEPFSIGYDGELWCDRCKAEMWVDVGQGGLLRYVQAALIHDADCPQRPHGKHERS